MKIYTRFSIKAIGLSDCSSIDLTEYSYTIKYCSATGSDEVFHTEPEHNFLKDGTSSLHCFEFTPSTEETPLAWCDILLKGKVTDKNIYINSFNTNSSENKWTVFNKKFSEGKTNDSSSYDKICIISHHRIFIDSRFSVGDPLDPFEKGKIERQLMNRLKFSPSELDYMFHSYPDQGQSSLCGPAIFLYALLKDRPDLYSQYIKDLWNNGKAKLGTLKINPSKGCCNPNSYTREHGQTKLPAIDWISMASLRDSYNITDYSSPDEEFSGMTLPSALAGWARGVDSVVEFSNMGLGAVPLYMIMDINNFVSHDNHVAVLINDGLL